MSGAAGHFTAAVMLILAVLTLTSCTPPTSLLLENKCRESLAVAAKSQDDYKSKNGKFGSFASVQAAGLIDSKKTLGEYTDGYTWGWFLDQDQSEFTIVATPREGAALKSYLIDKNGAVMVLNPREVKDPGRVWKAIIEAEALLYSEDHHYAWPSIPEYQDPNLALSLQIGDLNQSFVLTNPGQVGETKPISDIGPQYIYLSSTEKYYKMEPAP